MPIWTVKTHGVEFLLSIRFCQYWESLRQRGLTRWMSNWSKESTLDTITTIASYKKIETKEREQIYSPLEQTQCILKMKNCSFHRAQPIYPKKNAALHQFTVANWWLKITTLVRLKTTYLWLSRGSWSRVCFQKHILKSNLARKKEGSPDC